MIQRIISGGQTGADRAALDWAIANNIQQGGWCPAGRRAEDGVIPNLYCLHETPQRDYRQRTKWNVRDSDATLIITPAAELTGGSRFTQEWAQKISRPCLHVFRCNEWPEWIRIFFETNSIAILNVAGPRSSGAAGIEYFVHEVLDEMLAKSSKKTFL
ncbi:Putative molybdenum carrier [Nitrosospira sp. Nsp11]|uniref:putative molybdenum carrier protein n=1 Tax=unclassified Nitrosospira TaxID=2609267 RepID=UPI000881CFB4|nr:MULTISPECIES: putative molybdenum carrier protein [unclassified Nitrosospira]SDA10755.1 Putative molybdenum carrier [Nitrosospira sp. Nsp18]SHL16591.1 Putative molybdenum carrier [Nitrosospira sp. Nsp11]